MLHESPRGEWGKSLYTRNRLRNSPYYGEVKDEDGRIRAMFQGRPIIERDTRINGGINVGTKPREAIVVDDTKDGILLGAYLVLLGRQRARAAIEGGDFKDKILNEAFDLARELMPYNSYKVDQLNIKNGLNNDTKVQLGFYIRNKCGVCRHQALLVAYLLEKLIDEGYLQGSVSYNRNTMEEGGHGFVRYTNSRGKVIIIDPAQDLGGLIHEIPKDAWDYRQPGADNPKAPGYDDKFAA